MKLKREFIDNFSKKVLAISRKEDILFYFFISHFKIDFHKNKTDSLNFKIKL